MSLEEGDVMAAGEKNQKKKKGKKIKKLPGKMHLKHIFWGY